MSKICKKCGKELPDGAVFCGSCGQKCDEGAEKGTEKKAINPTVIVISVIVVLTVCIIAVIIGVFGLVGKKDTAISKEVTVSDISEVGKSNDVEEKQEPLQEKMDEDTQEDESSDLGENDSTNEDGNENGNEEGTDGGNGDNNQNGQGDLEYMSEDEFTMAWFRDEYISKIPLMGIGTWVTVVKDSNYTTAIIKDITVSDMEGYAYGLPENGFSINARVINKSENEYSYYVEDKNGYYCTLSFAEGVGLFTVGK